MSRLPFELLLALRYLRPKRTFVSVISLISVLGVTLGVAVLIIVISVMTGFDRHLRETILGFDAHLKIVPADREHVMKDYRAIERAVSSNRFVKAVAPFVLGPVLVQTESQTGASSLDAPYVRGINPLLESNISVLPDKILEGKFDVNNRGLLIGTEFADKMNLQVGDRVEIGSPSVLKEWREQSKKPDASAPVLPEYEIRGIFDVGYYEFNDKVIVTSLRDAQDLYDLGNSVHGLLVVLHNPDHAPATQAELGRSLGPGYRIVTWMEANALFKALIVEKNVMFFLLFFITIVAAMCILSALITFVIQKTREIGMLKALGATDPQVTLIFLSQGALLGAIGDLAGYALGMLAIAYRNEFLHFMNRMTGFELFPPSIYGFDQLPALISPRDIV